MDSGIAQAVRERAGSQCEYCRDPEALSLAAFHIEHVIARQHGGNDHLENLALACPDCNWRKGPNLASLDPTNGILVPLFHPRTDRWDRHFAWRGVFIEGRTPVGRATGQLLDLNAESRRKHRTLLVQLGLA